MDTKKQLLTVLWLPLSQVKTVSEMTSSNHSKSVILEPETSTETHREHVLLNARSPTKACGDAHGQMMESAEKI